MKSLGNPIGLGGPALRDPRRARGGEGGGEALVADLRPRQPGPENHKIIKNK